jgi:hypothetical protein
MLTISQNSTLAQILLIALQEVKSSFANKRGIFIAFVYAVLWMLLLVYPIQFAAESMNNPDTSSFAVAILNTIGLESLKDWLFSELAMYWVAALILFPFFSLLMSVDQLISERNRGGLRFLVLRSYRQSIFIGRFLGHLAIQGIFISLTLCITYVFIFFNASDSVMKAITILPIIFINLLIVTIPFIALMSFFSVIMKSVVMAYIMVFVFYLSAKFIIYSVPLLTWIKYAIPGYQLTEMMSQSPQFALMLLWLPILQGVGLLLLGFSLFKRLEL